MWKHPSREMIETPWSSSLDFLQLSLLLLTPDPSPGKADGNQRASSPTNSLASIPEIPQWPCTCVGGRGCCTCLASSPAPYCHRGKQLLWPEHGRASQHPSEHSGSWGDLIYYHYSVGGLVDFLGFGPFADHNSICRVPNLRLSHRHLCGSAKTSAEHHYYRIDHQMENIVSFC